ncbi:MAG: hypothetical protein R2762_20650 [Bryobacteraceae bacterium]
MYAVMLAPGNRIFAAAVERMNPRFQTDRLKQVIQALETAQKVPSAATLLNLLNTMNAWRTGEPAEYTTRGGTDGVYYRLWMEAKQMLANRFHQNYPGANPPIPPNCPGDTILGVYVPPGEGQVEICHGFAYRWAIAAGRIAENPLVPTTGVTAFNAQNMTPVLYPLGFNGYPAARAGGVMQVQAGDIVAMFTVLPAPNPPALGHSLIAETPTIWFSANNAGTFGVGTGRSQINTAGAFGVYAGNQVGWVGNGNQWMRPDGVAVHVVYRR